jgi:hypothetical protein
VIVVVIAGHFGASLTHGVDFILEPVRNTDEELGGDTTVFAALVLPILETKCQSCHNTQKHKGGLDVSSLEAMLRGGENGPLWVAGDAEHSALIHHAMLPINHKAHMPPEGKPQLSSEEIQLLKDWLAEGANTTIRTRELADNSKLISHVESYVNTAKQTYDFEDADDLLIQKLNGPYRKIERVAPGSPALVGSIFGIASFEHELIAELNVVGEQIVQLNLPYLPISTQDLEVLAGFTNLESLNLNFTEVTNQDLKILHRCTNLKSLSLSGTQVGEGIEQVLSGFPSLQKVFLWNTQISRRELLALKEKLPGLSINTGYDPSKEEKLPLTTPQLASGKTIIRPDEPVVLKHQIEGVTIRYTVNGQDPDSTSQRFDPSKPLFFDSTVSVKTIAQKEGWKQSEVRSFQLHPRGVVPKSVDLMSKPYRTLGAIGASSLIDEVKGEDNLSPKAWLGFINNPLIAWFDFGEENSTTISEITLSYALLQWRRFAPPKQIRIWGGDQKDNMQLLADNLVPYDSETKGNMKLLKVSLPSHTYQYYKIEATPYQSLPEWHGHSGKAGFIVVDQIFFY